MGQSMSCVMLQHHQQNQHRHRRQSALFDAVANGELEVVEAMAEEDVTVLEHTLGRSRLSPLHVAAVNGRIEVLVVAQFRCQIVDEINENN